jgi:protein-S-isoprenylcysteine O-methyltransferase Ste14
MRNRNQVIGIILIVVGILVLMGRMAGAGNIGWPLFVLVPGVALLAWAFLGGEEASTLAIPGSIVTTIGLILFVQNLGDYFQSWSYAWGLIVSGVGFGIFLQGALTADHDREREGMRVVTVGLALFAAFGAFFEFFVFDNWAGSWVGRWLLPLALIAAGLVLWARRGAGGEGHEATSDSVPDRSNDRTGP